MPFVGRPTVKVTINGQDFNITSCYYAIWTDRLTLEGNVSRECIELVRGIWEGKRICDFDIDCIAHHDMRIQFEHVKGQRVSGRNEIPAYSLAMQASLRRKDGIS